MKVEVRLAHDCSMYAAAFEVKMNSSRAPLIVVSLLLLLLILIACGTAEVDTLQPAVWDQSLWNQATWQ